MIRSLPMSAATLIVVAAGLGAASAADTSNGDKAPITKTAPTAPSNGCDFETNAGPHSYGGNVQKSMRHVGEGDTVANASTGVTWICKNGKLVRAK
jgi:hypothetical protein